MSQLQTWIVIAAIASPPILAIIGIPINQKGFERIDNRMIALTVAWIP